jgi:hypothetical protein
VPACATKPGCPASASLEAHGPADVSAAGCVFHADVLLADSVSSSEFDPDQTFTLGFCFSISTDYWGESDGPVVLNFEPVADVQPGGGGSPIRGGLVDLGDPVTGQTLDPAAFVPPDDPPQLPCGDTPEQYFKVGRARQDVCNLPPVSIAVTPGSPMAHRVTDCFSWYARYAQSSPIVQELYSFFNHQYQSALGIPQYVKVTENNLLVLDNAAGETHNTPAGPEVQMVNPSLMGIAGATLTRPIVFDMWCTVLFHELAHAYGDMAGVGARSNTPCSLGGGVKLDQRELFAMAAQNSYMIAKGQAPLDAYGLTSLPDSIQHPTADVWARLKQGLCP